MKKMIIRCGLSLLFVLFVACTKAHHPTPAQLAIQDGHISAKVRAKLISHQVTEHNTITVSTYEGWVTLRGRANNEQQVALAKHLAAEVVPFWKVHDHVEVYVDDSPLDESPVIRTGS